MSSLMFSTLLICFVVIYNLSNVSSDCTSCCLAGTGCDTAYGGESGKCCAQGLGAYCCPTSSICRGDDLCEMLYWGMQLGVFIAVIAGVVVACMVVLLVCCRLLSNRRPPVAHTMVLQPTYHRPDVYHVPPPDANAYKY